jgi:hypothetical protein
MHLGADGHVPDGDDEQRRRKGSVRCGLENPAALAPTSDSRACRSRGEQELQTRLLAQHAFEFAEAEWQGWSWQGVAAEFAGATPGLHRRMAMQKSVERKTEPQGGRLGTQYWQAEAALRALPGWSSRCYFVPLVCEPLEASLKPALAKMEAAELESEKPSLPAG